MSMADMLGGSNAMEQDPDENDMDHNGQESEEDEGAVDLMGNNTGDEDSSEEEDEGSDAEREVRKGFIVDEDDSRSRKKRKKRPKGEEGARKRRKDKDSGDEVALDDDDLALMEENTGMKLGAESSKLKRLRRRRSQSAESAGSPARLDNIFDDDTGGGLPFDADEMAGFIEDDSDSEEDDSDGGRRKKEKKKKPKGRQQVNRKATGRVEGITAEAWQEVMDVFGDGSDYRDALDIKEVEDEEEKELKDIFEPSEIASRMLTAEDDDIRVLDIPERMQLASAGLPSLGVTEDGHPTPYIAADDLDNAAIWISTRISARSNEEFILADMDGNLPKNYGTFLKAVKNVVISINVHFLEVPYIWAHKPDHLVAFDPNVEDESRDIFLFDMDDLWVISALSVKYRAFTLRRAEVRATFDSLNLNSSDEYFETLFEGLESVEDVADTAVWLSVKYAAALRLAKEVARDIAREAEEDAPKPKKRATRESRYEQIKGSTTSELAELMAIPSAHLAQDFETGSKTRFKDDPETMPLELALQYGSEFSTPEATIGTAKEILIHEISSDPSLKKQIRKFFETYAVVSVRPTAQGFAKIDELHPYYNFKYLSNKPVKEFSNGYQYLQILAAETEGHVTSSITLESRWSDKLLEDLKKIYNSDYASTIAEAWNEIRTSVLEIALADNLIPAAAGWMKNKLQEAGEMVVSNACTRHLSTRINVAPFRRSDETMNNGETPSVLALSYGAGDPKRDSVMGVFLDSEGHLREHFKVDNLTKRPEDRDYDSTHREAFIELIRRRRPQVIVIGGFSAVTKDLMAAVKDITAEVSRSIVTDGDDESEEDDLTEDERIARAYFECIYVYDDVARIYQNSKRAMGEFPDLVTLGRYCVGLARYAQNPLNEYAALGEDLTAVNYHPGQKFLSRDKIMYALERALINVTNNVGVDINRAIRDSYYYYLLPYVAGLGPRKASTVVKKINGPIGGTLVSRSNLITNGVMTHNVWMNSASFLRISQDDLAADLKRNADDDQPDILDETRIHSENYEVARKMAADAMEYDEEDTAAFRTPSQAVVDLRDDDPTKLDELSLDEFAAELFKMDGISKRLLLYSIRNEMKNPFAENRLIFSAPTIGEVFTMLTGETPKTLEAGLIVPVRVLKVTKTDEILVRLDSGIEGSISAEFSNGVKPRVGSTIQALVMELRPATFEVDLSTQTKSTITGSDFNARKVQTDKYFDLMLAETEKDGQISMRKKTSGRQNRVIKHPNFYNFNSGQAELHLSSRQRGDCVIRPSSTGALAITWKVDTDLYQHIPVKEEDKPNEFALGRQFIIEPRIGSKGHKWIYSDLDEMIVSHVKAMARKVDELTSHEKFKGSVEEMNLFLQNYTMANPDKSTYAFGLDRSANHAGDFILGYKTSAQAEISKMTVQVIPGAFVLNETPQGDVVSLCNGFKESYTNGTNYDNRTAYRKIGTPLLHRNGSGSTPRSGATPNPWNQNNRGGNSIRQGNNPIYSSAPVASGSSSSYQGGGGYNRSSGYTPILSSRNMSGNQSQYQSTGQTPNYQGGSSNDNNSGGSYRRDNGGGGSSWGGSSSRRD